MLRRLQSDYKADYKAVVFDPRGKTFRDDWYPEYKAHRPPMPDDLRPPDRAHPRRNQGRRLAVLIMIDGVEADDVIGTLATQRRRGRHRHADLDRRQGFDPAGRPNDPLVQHDEQRIARRGRRAPPSSACRPSASSITWRWLAMPWTTCRALPSVARRPAVEWLTAVRHARQPGGQRRCRERRGRARTCATTSTSCHWARSWSPSSATCPTCRRRPRRPATPRGHPRALRELYKRYQFTLLAQWNRRPGRGRRRPGANDRRRQ